VDVVFQIDKSVFNYRVAGVWIENGHVLLHRMVGEEHWSLPGGRVAMMEESKTSLKREFFEELGIHIKVNQLIWIVENFFEYNGKNFHEIGLYYSVSPERDTSHLKAGDFYGVEGERLLYRWFPLEKLGDVTLYPLFLKEELKKLPNSMQHIIATQK
jgi:8-oxo-dGTP pyrophosphatase MutT (NUDIX family)